VVEAPCIIKVMKPYILFLDDEREPSYVPELLLSEFPVVVARSFSEAVQIVSVMGAPHHISFDHDIASFDESGKEQTGYDFAKWLCEEDMNDTISLRNTNYNVHSMNPIGAKNIKNYLSSYFKFRYGV
jgi:hypothetical protein